MKVLKRNLNKAIIKGDKFRLNQIQEMIWRGNK